MAIKCMIGRKAEELGEGERRRSVEDPCDPRQCATCGWNREEYARRKDIPLTKDENGLRHKNVAKKKEEETE